MQLLRAINAVTDQQLEKLTRAILRKMGNGTIFVCGNGGSASTAEHMTCDISKTSYKLCKRTIENRIKTVSLSSNMATITATANDVHYQNVFSDQLELLAEKDDLLIVITASGNSPNIIKAVETAHTMGIYTFGLLGFGGGIVKEQLDGYICIDSYDYGVVEDCHLMINHMIADYLKSYMPSVL
jgi:D-sedoheptulose 7-phosphate isomerase